MPSLLTHYFFANKTMKNASFLKNNLALVNIGCQGTDPFFFYGTFLRRKNIQTIRGFATTIHHIDPFDFFNSFIEEANISIYRDKLFSYLYGLINHYCLDRNCHPYVFYQTGWGTEQHLIDHQKFEANIDCCLQHHFSNRITPSKTLKNKKSDIELISKIYSKYNQLPPNAFYLSYRDMQIAEKLLYSHFGIRKNIFRLFMPNSTINAMSLPKRREGNIDYLNTNKTEWQLPFNGAKTNESFFDLWQKAAIDFEAGYQVLLLAYQKKDYQQALKSFTNQIIHDGHPVNSTMKYFKSVYASLNEQINE